MSSCRATNAKRHPPTANAFLVIKPCWNSVNGPRVGDVVTLSGVCFDTLTVEIAAPGVGQRARWGDWVASDLGTYRYGSEGWAMFPEDLHPLDDGARAALDLVRS